MLRLFCFALHYHARLYLLLLGCLCLKLFRSPSRANTPQGLRVFVNPNEQLDDLLRCKNLATLFHAFVKDLRFLLAEGVQLSQQNETL